MTSEPPTSPPRLATRRVSSLVLLHTGEGKGKSTAAFGTALRAAGHGKRVGVVQFLKSGRWRTGEEAAARRLDIDWWTLGDGFTWDSTDMDRTHAVAREAWRAARAKLASGDYDLLVLDEITYAVTWGWIDVEEVVAAIRDRPSRTSVVLTGRDAPRELVELADTATEMRKLKHAYDGGTRAMKGIDF